MATHLPQNQFITNPAMPTTGSAVAFSDPSGSDATAALFETLACSSAVEQGAVNARVTGSNPVMPATPPMTMEVSQEAPALDAPNAHEDAGAINHIHEIFHYVRKLMKQPPRFVLDEERFMAAIEPAPIRRRA